MATEEYLARQEQLSALLHAAFKAKQDDAGDYVGEVGGGSVRLDGNFFLGLVAEDFLQRLFQFDIPTFEHVVRNLLEPRETPQ